VYWMGMQIGATRQIQLNDLARRLRVSLPPWTHPRFKHVRYTITAYYHNFSVAGLSAVMPCWWARLRYTGQVRWQWTSIAMSLGSLTLNCSRGDAVYLAGISPPPPANQSLADHAAQSAFSPSICHRSMLTLESTDKSPRRHYKAGHYGPTCVYKPNDFWLRLAFRSI